LLFILGIFIILGFITTMFFYFHSKEESLTVEFQKSARFEQQNRLELRQRVIGMVCYSFHVKQALPSKLQKKEEVHSVLAISLREPRDSRNSQSVRQWLSKLRYVTLPIMFQKIRENLRFLKPF
ncbi:MAG: hypothetical protein AAFV80_10060, partial [Bacteroidota bacterium]